MITLAIEFCCPGFIPYFHFFEISQGWTLYEILRYAPEHNWIAYEEALKTNPVLAKMAISGIVYSIGDWIAQVSHFLFSPYFPFFLNGFWLAMNLFFVNSLVLFDLMCSVMKGSRYLTLTRNAWSDQALLGLPFMDPYLIITTNSVR